MFGLPQVSEADVVANIRGVAFAATAPTETIARLLGCSLGDAELFQM